MRIISANPLPRSSHPFRRHGPLPFPFGEGNATFWYCARSAIVQGVRALGLRAGDRVLAPAYACGSEIDALVGERLELDFYGIHPDLSIDMNQVAQLCRETQKPPVRALFVTHYLGFPQDMDTILDFTRQHDIFVIEDNAHGLYSADPTGRPLGSRGDAGVFSLTKTLPVPDGGALAMNRENHLPVPQSLRPPVLPVAGKTRYLAEQAIEQTSRSASRFLRERLLNPLVRRVKAGARVPHSEREDVLDILGFKRERANWDMSPLAHAGARLAASPLIPETRRANYLALLERIEPCPRIRPLLTKLPDGCCPLLFPIVVDRPAELMRYLASADIRVKHFWSISHPRVPLDRFALETSLKQRTVALPIHQDLGLEDMVRIATAIRDWRDGARTAASTQ